MSSRYHDQPAHSGSYFSFTNNIIRQRSQRMKCITVSVLGCAIFSILFAYVAFGESDSVGKPVIKLAFVITRHGDRNPTESYPTDPFGDVKFWPGGWGALTNKGKLQMYNLGVFLRSRYKELLSEVYSPDHLLVRSSYKDRCLMSAAALVAGLQPPSASEIWLPGLNWHPIPIHSTPRSLDQLIVVKKKCQLYDRELQTAYESEQLKKVNDEYSGLYKQLSLHTGKNISTVLDVEYLFNTLEIEEANGFKLPAWTESLYPEPMKTVSLISLGVFTHNPTMKRLVGGPLINDIVQKMQENSKNSLILKPEFFLILGHDVTVINVMRSLGFDDAPKPELGASILFELHAGPPGLGDDFIKIFYTNSSSTTEPIPLTLPDCNEPCKLTEFVSSTAKISINPSQWESECKS